jgi:hypothetical protein
MMNRSVPAVILISLLAAFCSGAAATFATAALVAGHEARGESGK